MEKLQKGRRLKSEDEEDEEGAQEEEGAVSVIGVLARAVGLPRVSACAVSVI